MKKRCISILSILLIFTTILTSCCIVPKEEEEIISTWDDHVEVAEQTNLGISNLASRTAINQLDTSLLNLDLEDVNEEQDALYSLIITCVAYDLSELGYSVYEGIATDLEGTSYLGLIVLNEEEQIDTETGLPTAGFLQLADSSTETQLTEDTVSSGVVAVLSEDTTYLVNQYVSLSPYSGVYMGAYFQYGQIAPYVLSIYTTTVDEDTVYDYSIDCYDFDEDRIKWEADPSARPVLEAYSLYVEEQKAYETACDAIQQLIDLQNANGYSAERTVLILIDPAILEALEMHETPEALNDWSMEAIRNIELTENSFLVLSATEGVQVFETQDIESAIEARRTSGIIQMITSGLMALGSIVIACATFGAATPVAITSIAVLTGAIATTYAVSNFIEGLHNVQLANCGDIYSEAANPVRDAVVQAFGEEHGATIYNAVGLGAYFIESLVIPLGSGLKLADAMGAGFGQTCVILLRATSVYLVKLALTAAASIGAKLGATYLTKELTGNENLAEYIGLASSLLVGALTMKGLNTLDAKFNFSGLYTKADVVQKCYVENKQKALSKFDPQKWSQMTESQQKSAINTLAKFIAKENGLGKNIPKIQYFNDPSSDTCGFYRDADNTVYINKAYWNDSAELVDTLAHEMQHAYQFQLIQQGVVNEVTTSYKNYISADEDLDGYFKQACEKDSYAKGTEWANEARETWDLDTNASVYEKTGDTGLEHIMKQHVNINANKASQGIFNCKDEKGIETLIKEAWGNRGTATIETRGTVQNYVYHVSMENAGLLYENGEYVGIANSIRIVVNNTNQLITAYPELVP